MHTIKVSVTEKHIKKATGGGRSCPIAQSLHDMGYKECWVYPMSVRLDESEEVRRSPITLPEEAQMFIQAFDNDIPVAPFEFELEVPNGESK